MGLKIIPDPIGRLGRGGLSVVGGGGALPYRNRVLALAPIAYWPLNEPVGTTGAGSVLDASGHSCTGTPTAVTFGATGIGDGETAASFLYASGSDINVYSAALNTGFGKLAGSVSLWIKPNAGIWTNAQQNIILRIATDGDNNLYLQKFNVDNTLLLSVHGATIGQDFSLSPYSFTTWTHLCVTWSSVAAPGSCEVFLDGVSLSSWPAFGVWSGALSATDCNIGAYNSSGVAPFSGDIAHVTLFDKVLTLTQIQGLANP
jgi:hypothetical protein